MSALGIVAAVLGVIKTMGSITGPPEVLGALVRTFLGVFVAYGFLALIANTVSMAYETEGKCYLCMKAGILAYLQDYAPAVCIEFACRALLSDVRPNFYEGDEAVFALPAVGA